MKTISIIVATHNRAALLDECLAHLDRQQFQPGDEVIVVDNGSTDETLDIIARHQRLCPAPLHGLQEPTPGKSHALARAIAAASGDVLALTDDDVNVADDWLAAIRAAMADGDVALIGGPVAPRWQRAAPWWLRGSDGRYRRLAAPLALLDYGPDRTQLGARAAIGANMAVRRDVLTHVGGFALHLGKLRGTLLSGEDHDLCQRVRAAGLRADYCPDVRVSHWVPAERTRLGYVLRWFFWSGITHAALEPPKPGDRTVAGVPLYLLRRFASGLLQTLASVCIANLASAVEHAADATFAAGYAAGRWRMVTSARPQVAHQL